MADFIFILVFEPQCHSKFVADTIGEHLRGFLDDQMICLLQSFIYPKEMMIENPEASSVLDESVQMFTTEKDFLVVPLQQQGASKPRDPIFELFNPPVDAKDGKCARSHTRAHVSDVFIQYFH